MNSNPCRKFATERLAMEWEFLKKNGWNQTNKKWLIRNHTRWIKVMNLFQTWINHERWSKYVTHAINSCKCIRAIALKLYAQVVQRWLKNNKRLNTKLIAYLSFTNASSAQMCKKPRYQRAVENVERHTQCKKFA